MICCVMVWTTVVTLQMRQPAVSSRNFIAGLFMILFGEVFNILLGFGCVLHNGWVELEYFLQLQPILFFLQDSSLLRRSKTFRFGELSPGGTIVLKDVFRMRLVVLNHF